MASSSAMTTLVGLVGLCGHGGSGDQRADSSAEMRSRSESCSCDELPHGDAQRVAVAGEGVGVATGVAGLDVGQRCLRDERAHALALGLLLEEEHLLLGDRELGTDALEALADVDQAPLQDRL